MGDQILRSNSVGILILVVCVIGGCVTDFRNLNVEDPYRMTVQILAPPEGLSERGLTCGDFLSRPEYFVKLTLLDWKAKAKLAEVRNELEETNSKITNVEETIARLNRGERETPFPSDRDRAKQGNSAQRSDRDLPPSDTELSRLSDLTEERTLLLAHQSSLELRKEALQRKTRMSTLDSIRIYPRDSVRVWLMEEDMNIKITPRIFDWSGDDVCGSWKLHIGHKIISNGGIDLKKRERTLLRLEIRPVSL